MSTDHCAGVRVSLEAMVDGELDASGLRAVHGHLRACPGCAEAHRQAVSLPGRLRALSSPPPPPSLVPAVMRAVRGRPLPAAAAGLLAVEAAIVLLVGWYLSGVAGLAAVATNTVRDVSELVGWGAGSASPPAPAAADLVLILACLTLIGLSALQLAMLARQGPRRPV